MYKNIPNSGVSSLLSNRLKPNKNWKDEGYFFKFDQRPFIKKALLKYVENGGDGDTNHMIDDFGYFYYPKECADISTNKKCKFQLAAHGAGGFDEAIINTFGPYAAPYEIVMVWPTVLRGGWDADAYSGK